MGMSLNSWKSFLSLSLFFGASVVFFQNCSRDIAPAQPSTSTSATNGTGRPPGTASTPAPISPAGTSPAPMPSGNITSTDPIDLYIINVYQRYLDRSVDNVGLPSWHGAFVDQGISRRDFVWSVILSHEFIEKFSMNTISNTNFIKLMYLKILGREAEADGITYYLSLISGGKTREEIVGYFLDSQEAKESNDF